MSTEAVQCQHFSPGVGTTNPGGGNLDVAGRARPTLVGSDAVGCGTGVGVPVVLGCCRAVSEEPSVLSCGFLCVSSVLSSSL